MVRQVSPSIVLAAAAALALVGAEARAQSACASGGTACAERSGDVAVMRRNVPEGWLGINYVAETRRVLKQRELFVVHQGYPSIVSVEPGSPADRAGLQAGDTILAYNDQDLVRHEVSLTKLLRPGAMVSVRVKRGRERYDIPVTVGRRPGMMGSAGEAVRVEVYGKEGRAKAKAAAIAGAVAPVPPMMPMPPSDRGFLWMGGGTMALAGAELARMNHDLGEIFGVEKGVLVINVGPDTPAARAGLRGGDVIVKCDGADVTTPSQFHRQLVQLARADDDEVTLVVVRRKKEQQVTLRW